MKIDSGAAATVAQSCVLMPGRLLDREPSSDLFP
jgi:hypothetical protein